MNTGDRQEIEGAAGPLTNRTTTGVNPVPRYQASRLHPVIWEPIRARVLNAYEGRCYACGYSIAQAQESSQPLGPGLWATPPQEANWHVHHRLPVVMGGGGARQPDEFLLLCHPCHDQESARERRSLALRLFLFRARSVLRVLQTARFPRPLLREKSGIARDTFNQTLRWLYRTSCVAGDAKSIGLTEHGEVALRQLEIHCRFTPQGQCVGNRPVRWFADGIWHPWLRTHLAIVIATECKLLPPPTEPIPLPCGEITCDPGGDVRLATHLIEQMAAISERPQMPPLNIALLTRLRDELYALEEWCLREITYRRPSPAGEGKAKSQADAAAILPPAQNTLHTRGPGND